MKVAKTKRASKYLLLSCQSFSQIWRISSCGSSMAIIPSTSQNWENNNNNNNNNNKLWNFQWVFIKILFYVFILVTHNIN